MSRGAARGLLPGHVRHRVRLAAEPGDDFGQRQRGTLRLAEVGRPASPPPQVGARASRRPAWRTWTGRSRRFSRSSGSPLRCTSASVSWGTPPFWVDGIHASLDPVLWVLNGYRLAYAVLLITSGRLADFDGLRTLFMAGLIVFTGASVFSGLAQDPTMLIAGRAAQGVGAAMLAQQTMAFMLSLLPPERRAPVFPCSASWLASPLSPARRPAASSSPTWAGAGSSSSTSQWARVRPVQPAVAGAHGLLLHAFQSLSAASQRRAPSDHLHVSQHRTARNFAIRPRHQSRLAVPSRRRSEFRMAPEEGLEPTTLRLTALPVASPTVPARPSVSLAVLRIGRRDA